MKTRTWWITAHEMRSRSGKRWLPVAEGWPSKVQATNWLRDLRSQEVSGNGIRNVRGPWRFDEPQTTEPR